MHVILKTSAALALALALTACGKSEETKAADAAAAEAAVNSPFAAIAAGKVDIEGGLVDIAARQPGIVREVLVQEGDEVREDQVLARIDDEEARLSRGRAAAELSQARAQVPVMRVALEAAERELARTQALADRNFVAPQRVETARDEVNNARSRLEAQSAALSVAQARLAEANYVVERHIVRAPTDGRIVRRYANPGSGASTLNVTPLFQLQPSGMRIVRAELEERSLGEVAVGMAVQIVPEADQSKTYEGVVIRIAQVFGARRLQSDDPSQQTDERVVEVVVDVADAPVLVGQRVLAKFVRAGAAAPTAPASN